MLYYLCMLLKSIDITGFKSFADKTELIIDNRITGIVGPNGSGKSNIADAVRWVLGEQSSKTLRGEKMEDVIFGGTEKRAKRHTCEVTLIFSNESGKIKSEFSEISVSRKMYSTGESEYSLNGQIVRLKDVIEMFRDTGIGKEGYSIVGQGRIDEILSSKPTVRRRVFEEAAGIMKYRVRREEAERKLDRTRENIVRAEDILEELGAQIEPMREQAERTKNYISMFERLRSLDANLFLTNHKRTNERIAALTEQLKSQEKELINYADFSSNAADELEKIEEQIEQYRQKSGEFSREEGEVKTQIERALGQIGVLEERQSNAESELFRIESEISEREDLINSLKIELDETTAQKDKIDAAIASLTAELTELENLNTQLAAAEQQRLSGEEQNRAEQLALIDEITSLRAKISEQSALAGALEGRTAELEFKLTAAKKMTAEAKTQLDLHEKNVAELTGRTDNFRNLYNENNAKLGILQDEIEEISAELSGKEIKLASLKTRYKMLVDIKSQYEGFSGSVRNLMTCDNSAIKNSLLGTIADLIKVPHELEVAVETVLAATLQNVVVKTETEAKWAIEYLRERRMGRVTFLPLEALKINYLDGVEERLLKNPGVVGVASELVSCSESVAPAVDFLLARTIIVDKIDNAIALMRVGGYKFRVVTLLGDILRPGGTITGGSTSNDTFLLSRERAIADEKEKIAVAETEITSLMRLKSTKESELFGHKNEAEELLLQFRQGDTALSEARQNLLSAGHVEKTAVERENLLLSELSDIGSGGADDDITQIFARLEQANAELETLRQVTAKTANEQFTEITAKLTTAKITVAEHEKEKESHGFNFSRLTKQISMLGATLAQSVAQKLDCESKKGEFAQTIKKINEQISELKNNLASRDERAETHERDYMRLRELHSTKKAEAAKTVLQRESILELKYKGEAQLEKYNTVLETITTRLWDEYELTYGNAEELKIEKFAYTSGVHEADELKMQIRGLGPINPNAAEDFERVNSRVDELTGQKDDLKKADADLVRVIDELNSTMRTRFDESFAKINEHFSVVFKDLFGGGSARLSTTGGDLLDCGVEISAEPPGKKLQSISLLSGGERALTAIALMFSMIKINPSPVCLLDEIDAPLDEANVVRFSNYLRKIDNTQFVLITHRKPTMAACDTLWGVAMEERGVSSLVSAKIHS